MLLDIQRSSAHAHDELQFQLCEVGPKHFTNRKDRLPIKLIDLSATEELIATKGKRRPAVVLFEAPGFDRMSLPLAEQRPSKALGVASFIVAPMYSTASIHTPGTFMPTIVARIRVLRYPHFACLPRLGVNDEVPGEIVRLDRLYATHLGRGSERCRYRLRDEIFKLLSDQLVWSATGYISDTLRTIADLVRDSLPPEQL
jgi:hypothetical protein